MKKEIEDFIETWEQEIPRIECRPIDSRGTLIIFNRFSFSKTWLQAIMSEEENDECYEIFHNIESKLTIALESSRSLYQLQNRGIWARIVENIAALTINKLPTKV